MTVARLNIGVPVRPEHRADGKFAKNNSGFPEHNRKLTKPRHAKIVETVRSGNHLSTAARAAGVRPRTLRKWLRRGQDDFEAGRRSTFLDLYRDVDRAVAENEVEIVRAVKLAGTTGVENRRVHRTAKPFLKDGEPQVVRDSKGDPVLDADGRVQYLETVVTHTEVRHEVDWRAGVRLLESVARSRFGAGRLEAGVRHEHQHVHLEMSEEDQRIAGRIAGRRLALLPPPVDVEAVDAGEGHDGAPGA